MRKQFDGNENPRGESSRGCFGSTRGYTPLVSPASPRAGAAWANGAARAAAARASSRTQARKRDDALLRERIFKKSDWKIRASAAVDAPLAHACAPAKQLPGVFSRPVPRDKIPAPQVEGVFARMARCRRNAQATRVDRQGRPSRVGEPRAASPVRPRAVMRRGKQRTECWA
jgi:hypothetical protein